MSENILTVIKLWVGFMVFCTSLYAQNSKSTLAGVVNANDGTPASHVTVSIEGTNKATQTDEKGKFFFKNVEKGTYKLKISAVGIKTHKVDIEVKEGINTLNAIKIAESADQLSEVEISSYRSSNKKASSLGKSGIAAKDLPQSVQIITTQVIQDQQADRLGDVMKNVNGVAMGANRGSVGENFYARGYSLGANNIFKNGARTTIGGSPEASTLESVEVLKGSAALLYGGVTGGAVVNMVTKRPRFDRTGGEVSFRAGSYGQYKGIVDFYTPVDDKVAVRLIGTGETADSFRDVVESKRLYINPSLLYKISENTDLLVLGDYLKSNYTPDFGVGTVANQIVDFGRDKFLNTPWAYNKTNTATAQANFNHRFNQNWKLNAIGSFQSFNRDYFGSERINPPATGIVARNVNRAKTQEYTYNQQINLNGEFNTGKIKHTVLVGADADQSNTTSNAFNYINQSGDLVSSYNYGNINVFDPATYLGDGYMPEAVAITQTKVPIYRFGTFVQDLVALSQKFKVLAGVRWSFQKTPQTDITTLATGVQSKGTAVTRIDKAFSPKVGLIYEPLKTTSLYVSYANNFSPNTGLDVYNQALKPSIIDQYEVGVKNDFFGGRLSANLTYNITENSNLAQTALFLPDGTANSNTNIKEFSGSTRSDSFEIDVTGSLAKGLNIIAGYAYNFMRFTNTLPTGNVEDVRLVGTTKNTGNATVFYTVQNGAVKGLKLGASAYYTGDRNGGWNDTKTATSSRVIPLEAFTTVDLSAGYTFKKVSLLAKVSNITNELNYYVHENYSVNPIPPRQFLTTLSYRF